MFERKDFENKVALVTGSSRGLGRGIILALGALGANCIVNYLDEASGRNRADADAVLAELQKGGGNHTLLQCDVGDFNQAAAMMAKVKELYGGLDILVNNAGILRDRTIKNLTKEEWDAVIRVNLTGVFNCTKHAAPLLRQGGRIVNISSLAGSVGFFGQANYASSKAGVMAITRVTAREMARNQITCNAVAPGVAETEMGKNIPEEVRKHFMTQIPLGRFGEVEDIANAVVFLCSPLAGYITGQVLHVNGGFFME
jgi:3-oxoacyl-[acyl-carrier protein] reductase